MELVAEFVPLFLLWIIAALHGRAFPFEEVVHTSRDRADLPARGTFALFACKSNLNPKRLAAGARKDNRLRRCRRLWGERRAWLFIGRSRLTLERLRRRHAAFGWARWSSRGRRGGEQFLRNADKTTPDKHQAASAASRMWLKRRSHNSSAMLVTVFGDLGQQRQARANPVDVLLRAAFEEGEHGGGGVHFIYRCVLAAIWPKCSNHAKAGSSSSSR
jgi:hypothetical protein